MTHEESRVATLAELRNILSSEEKWTKGTHARNAAGEPTDLDEPDAVCFSLLGAYILARRRTVGYETLIDSWLFDRHYSRYPDWRYNIRGWNDADTTTYEDVIDLLA